MFELTNVTYKHILNIEKLTIQQGIVTCIVGPSGSGKSTLIKLLNKLISCDSGTISYNNKNLDDYNPVELRRDVVMLPQSPAIYDGTIKENLLIGLYFSEKPMASDADLQDVLTLVKLYKNLDESPIQLSGGEKQRLALARILLMHPTVLLLDEPSSALDEETEKIIIDAVVQYAKSNNRTLIMVTHSKAMASRFAEERIDLELFNNKTRGGMLI